MKLKPCSSRPYALMTLTDTQRRSKTFRPDGGSFMLQATPHWVLGDTQRCSAVVLSVFDCQTPKKKRKKKKTTNASAHNDIENSAEDSPNIMPHMRDSESAPDLSFSTTSPRSESDFLTRSDSICHPKKRNSMPSVDERKTCLWASPSTQVVSQSPQLHS